MKKSSVAVNLFRALCVGSVIFIGGYTIAQGLLNSDNTNVDIGPYEVTFKLDMDDEATNKICTEAIEDGRGNCRDVKVKAYYQDNFQTIDVPSAGKEYPYQSGKHIQWDKENLMNIKSSVIVKGRYVEDEILHNVRFYLDYKREELLGNVMVTHNESISQEALNYYRSLGVQNERVSYQFDGFSAYYASEIAENKFKVAANYGTVTDDLDILLTYSKRFIKVNFYDENMTLIEGINREVLYNSPLGDIPTEVSKKLEELKKKEDGYYYLAHFKSENGVFTITDDIVDPDLIVEDKTKNIEEYNIGIFKKDTVEVKFITEYNNNTYTVRVSFNYLDKHVFEEADFAYATPEELKNVPEVTIKWPMDDYIGKVIDSDMVIRSEVEVKKLNIDYKVLLQDLNDPTAYDDVTSEFDYSSIKVNYGSKLSSIPDVYGLLEYAFIHFKLSNFDKELTYEELLKFTFVEDTTISVYFKRKAATVYFKSSVDIDNNKAILNTYVGADNVILPVGVKPIAPEGKYFTGKWEYSYKVVESGVIVTKKVIYDSNNSADRINVTEPTVELTPVFSDIRVTVEIYQGDKTSIISTTRNVMYGSDLTDVFNFALGSLNASGDNVKFAYWSRFDDLLTNCTPEYIKGENGDVLKFYPEFMTSEHHVIFKNKDGSEITRYIVDGTKTVQDYITQLENDSSVSVTIPGGFEFERWSIASPDFALDTVVPLNSNLSIIAVTTAKEYNINFVLDYVIKDATGTSSATQSFASANQSVTVGQPLGADNYDLLLKEVSDYVKANYTSVAGISNLDNYSIASSFMTMDNLLIGSSTPIQYNDAYISVDGSDELYNINITIKPKKVKISYQTGEYDLYGRMIGVKDIYQTTYEYFESAQGYEVKYKEHFGPDKFASESLYTFIGWTDKYNNFYEQGGLEFISNDLITEDLTIVAKYNPIKPSVRIFGLKTLAAFDVANEIDLMTFSSNYVAAGELTTDYGSELNLSSSDVLKNALILYIANNNSTQSSSITIHDEFFIEGKAYRISGVRELGTNEEVIPIDDFLSSTISSLTRTINYVLVLEESI